MDSKLPAPGSAARSAEQEPSTPNVKVEPGSAARIAEQGAHETTAVPREAFRGTMSIRTRAVSGAKFEFAVRHEGPGEALPEGYKPPASATVANPNMDTEAGHLGPGKSEADGEEQTLSGGGWAGRLRKLFGR
jgi:hypothetical protein